MFSRAVQSMYQTLRKLRLYALTGDTLVDAELAAYNTGFAMLEHSLQSLERQAFLQTAKGDELIPFEELVGMVPLKYLDDATRRRLIMQRMQISPADFTTKAMLKSIYSTGVVAALTEMPSQEAITVVIQDYIDPRLGIDQITNRLDQILPSHLTWSFDYGTQTWDIIEAKYPFWDTWDNAGFTWNEFDSQKDT